MNLIDIESLNIKEIEDIISLASQFRSDIGGFNQEPIYGDKKAGILFFEPSTRTKSSFEIALLNLGAQYIDIRPDSSSITKGESLENTIETLALMGIELFVIRHPDNVIYDLTSKFPNLSFINAGAGITSHPTQALSDLLTVKEFKKDLSKLNISIIGDLDHSRVARSFIELTKKIGCASLRFSGLPELCSNFLEADYGSFHEDLDSAIENADLIMGLRIQKERIQEALSIEHSEYLKRYQLTESRLALAAKDYMIFHPGPVNYGIEFEKEIADLENCKVSHQVANGVGLRMAVLAKLFSEQ
jgi:aspartate carbamoyltransferase catalytic subunit